MQSRWVCRWKYRNYFIGLIVCFAIDMLLEILMMVEGTKGERHG